MKKIASLPRQPLLLEIYSSKDIPFDRYDIPSLWQLSSQLSARGLISVFLP